MYLSISHSFLDCFAWDMDQIQAISHVHTAAWPNDWSLPVITGYWPVIENFHNWKNRTDNFQKRQKPDWWSSHKSGQFSLVSVFFPVLRLDFKTLFVITTPNLPHVSGACCITWWALTSKCHQPSIQKLMDQVNVPIARSAKHCAFMLNVIRKVGLKPSPGSVSTWWTQLMLPLASVASI